MRIINATDKREHTTSNVEIKTEMYTIIIKYHQLTNLETTIYVCQYIFYFDLNLFFQNVYCSVQMHIYDVYYYFCSFFGL